MEKEHAVGVGKSLTQTAMQDYAVMAKRVQIGAQEESALEVGSASMVFKQCGQVLINGAKVQVNGTDSLQLKSAQITENG